jgi:hypothetical protein
VFESRRVTATILKSDRGGGVVIDSFNFEDPTHFLHVSRFLHFI